MTSERALQSLLAALLAGVLAGCPAGGGNSVQSGIRVHLAEVHMESGSGTSAHSARLGTKASTPKAGVQGGYAHDQLAHQHGHDRNGLSLSTYRSYLVLDNLELVQCASLARLPLKLIAGAMGVAHAHGGAGEPVGGRALDKPNVIDLMTDDDFLQPLGDVAVAPGRYCGLRVAVVRMAGDAYGKPGYAAASHDDPITVPEIPDLAGKAFSIRADYCAERRTTSNPDGSTSSTCVRRARADADDVGLTLPPAVTLNFDEPIVLDATHREAHVALGIAYGDWLHDVDVTLLNSDANERQKLLNNVVSSLHIHTAGAGAFPPGE